MRLARIAALLLLGSFLSFSTTCGHLDLGGQRLASAAENPPPEADRPGAAALPDFADERARMVQLIRLLADLTQAETGIGEEYQAAVPARLGAEVYSVEIIPELARAAAQRLERLGYAGVQVRAGEEWHVAALDDPETRRRVSAERACVARIGAGCLAPVAAHHDGEGLTALIAAEDGSWVERRRGDDPAALADELLAATR